MQFTKMHGLGNDYIYLDLTEKIREYDYSFLAQILSDRHFGVGSDGVIAILPSTKADFAMRIYNADGKEAEMCGNGIRCVGKYVYDNELTNKKVITIETFAGIKHLSLKVEDEKVVSVKVDMGVPTLHNGDAFNLEKAKHVLNAYNRSYEVIDVSMGNPHTVVFVPNICDYMMRTSGVAIEGHNFYPHHTNVEFVSVINDDTLEMRVYERGVGETMACGTGACASAFAYMEMHPNINKVTVKLLGGELLITKEKDHIFMEGSATKVYEGKVNLNDLTLNPKLVLKKGIEYDLPRY